LTTDQERGVGSVNHHIKNQTIGGGGHAGRKARDDDEKKERPEGGVDDWPVAHGRDAERGGGGRGRGGGEKKELKRKKGSAEMGEMQAQEMGTIRGTLRTKKSNAKQRRGKKRARRERVIRASIDQQ